MLNKNSERELAYVVHVDGIEELPGYDRVESAIVGGWRCIVPKGQFQPGSLGIYFEIDSRVPADNPAFAFMEKRNYKVKTQKMCKSISQGLLMAPGDFGWKANYSIDGKYIEDNKGGIHYADDESRFLTKILGVTYADAEDNVRKFKNMSTDAKLASMKARHKKLFSNPFIKKLMRYKWFRKIMLTTFGKKSTSAKSWPDGKFEGVKRTDQERVENMPWILNDKTPFIVTQKCDGSSGTYILERKGHNKFEFYVCSRNVRMANQNQECFYGEHNYYWEVAIKYDIENKMKQWLINHPNATFVCWQGEICAPAIQKNPHHLTEAHLYCFHWTDSINGRRDIREAAEDWKKFDMEVVPIVDDNFIMPDTMEELKVLADGYYDSSVCEGNDKCAREGFVYYKITEPNFSFKNVSREYLLKH